jgi:hypothetical protein
VHLPASIISLKLKYCIDIQTTCLVRLRSQFVCQAIDSESPFPHDHYRIYSRIGREILDNFIGNIFFNSTYTQVKNYILEIDFSFIFECFVAL